MNGAKRHSTGCAPSATRLGAPHPAPSGRTEDVTPAPIDLIIFDCDGVLVDSEPISIGVLREVISAAGGSVSEEVAYDRFLGRSMATIRDLLHSDFGLAVTDAHLERMRGDLNERFRRELKAIDGIHDAVVRLSFRRCVASSSKPERIRLSLEVTGLLDLFEPHIYSSTMVENGKPAPDLFLHAAASMGVAPQACVVIEDSPAGVEAARRAGMRVLAFSGGAHAAGPALRAAIAALGPDREFSDMRALPELIASLAAGERTA